MTRLTEQQFAEMQAKRPNTSNPPFALPTEPNEEPVTITLAEQPQGKQRARSFIKPNGKMGHYTPEDTRRYEGRIRTAAWDAMRVDGKLRQPFEGPVEMVLRIQVEPPASWSKTKRAEAMGTRPTTKPDCSNILKAWEDALNGIVYRDDAQIADLTVRKRYAPQALVVATVVPVR